MENKYFRSALDRGRKIIIMDSMRTRDKRMIDVNGSGKGVTAFFCAERSLHKGHYKNHVEKSLSPSDSLSLFCEPLV